MHIQYTGSGYEGGAHDNYGFSERIFDLKNNKKLELKDITSTPKAKLEAMLMKNIDNINSGTMDGDGSVKTQKCYWWKRFQLQTTSILMTKSVFPL